MEPWTTPTLDPRRPVRGGRRRRSVGLAVLLACACRPAQTSAPGPVEAAPTPAPRVRATDAASPAVAVATSPLQLLPDTTIAVGSVAGIDAVLAVIDVGALVDKYRGPYEQLAALVSGSTGVNLLDPTQWREAGVDPDGAMGAAMLDVRSETFAGFLKLSDPTRFRAFLDRIAGERRLRPVIEDRGLVLKREPDSATAIVLRDGFAFLVTTGRLDEAPYDFARLLATIDPARGLTATPRYQRATASPEPPRPLTAYVDLWAIVQGEQLAQEARRRDPEPSWAEHELEQAVQSGAPAEEQARLRQQADEQRAWEQRHAERRQREFDLLRRWLGPVEPIVFEFTASRTGVEGKIRVKMPETAPLRAVLQNAATPSPVLAALGERALLQVGGNVDVAAAIAGVEDVARANGEDPAAAYAELRTSTGVDFKAEVLPLLAGSGGFALTVPDALLRAGAGGEGKDLGFALALAVKDVAAAQALLAKVVQRMPVKAGKDARTGAHTLALPGYRTVYATVTATQIVVTTDVGVIRRLVAGGPASHGVGAAAVPVVTARDAAVLGMFDAVLPRFLLRSGGAYELDMHSFEPYGMFPDVAPAQIEKVPRSRAYKAKLRLWEALHAKIRKEEQAEERRRAQRILAMSECFGVLAAHLREQPDGLELTGGQFFGKGGLTRAFELAVESTTTTHGAEKTWELYSQRSELEEDLRRIRSVDVATALRLPTPLQ